MTHVDTHGHRVSLHFGPSGPPTIEHGEGGRKLSTRFELRGSNLDLRRPSRERTLLRERCRYASFVIEVDGERVNMGHRVALISDVPCPSTEIRVDDPPRDIGVAVMLADPEPPQMLVLTRGVLSETIRLDGKHPDFRAIVDADLRKDLVQRDARRDREHLIQIRAACVDSIPDVHACIELSEHFERTGNEEQRAIVTAWLEVLCDRGERRACGQFPSTVD